MRIARILGAAALTALTALALTATSANAQIDVTDEATGDPCDPVTIENPGPPPHTVHGGCEILAEGEVELEGHLFGIEQIASDCIVEFEAHIDNAGEGWVDEAEFHDHPDPACERVPCEAEPNIMEAWPIHGEENAPGNEVLHAEFCVVNVSNGDIQRCGVTLPINGEGHDYELAADDQGNEFHIGGENHENATNCEVEGQIHIEENPSAPHTEIEIAHS